MKKVLLAIMLCSLMLSSCTKADINGSENEVPVVKVFSVDGELPEIGEFTGSKAHERFYEEYAPDFIPSDEYGEIIPYVGNYRTFVKTDSPDWQAEQGYAYYGFCTSDGKIVMDASDKTGFINYFETDDGFGYYSVSREIEQKDDAPDEFFSNETLIIPKDGSWCITLEPGSWMQGSGYGHFATCIYPRYDEEGIVKTVIYDYNGNVVTTLEGVDSVYFTAGGLLYTSKWENSTSYQYYMNYDGEIVFGPYQTLAHFNDKGITYVEDYNDEWYFVNADGTRLTYKEYDAIHRNGGYDSDNEVYVARYPDGKRTIDVYNGNAEIIGTIYGVSGANFRFPDNGEIIYSFYSDSGREIFKKLADNSDFVSKEYGVMPNSYEGDDNTYIYKDDEKNIGVIFDGSGDTVAVIDDLYSYMDMSEDGRFITYSVGDYDFALDAETRTEHITDSRRTVVFDLETKEQVYSVNGSGYTYFVGDNDRYVHISIYNETSFFGGTSTYYLFDTLTGKAVFADAKQLTYTKVGENEYYSVSTENTCTLYDGNMNIIIKLYNE